MVSLQCIGWDLFVSLSLNRIIPIIVIIIVMFEINEEIIIRTTILILVVSSLDHCIILYKVYHGII